MAPPDGFRSIDELTLAHQRVLIRVDFDVPLGDDGQVASDDKLRAALPTLQKALKEGARVVLATHLGAPDDEPRSLEPVAARLAELLGQEVYLPDECVGDAARKVVSDLREGQLCLLENLYLRPEEAQNDDSLARKLFGLCDAYISEAFACSHLTQASLVALPRLLKERGIGYRFKAELDALSRAKGGAQKPFVGILGGESLSRSLPVFEIMLRRCDSLCVGGAVANTLLAARSVDMKASLVEREQLALGRALLSRARDQKVDVLLPIDVLTGQDGDSADGHAVSVGSLADGASAFDIGPKTLDAFRARIASAKTVLWHGALGALENPAFSAGTEGMLSSLAEAPAFGIVTGEALSKAARARGPELESSIGLVSTGGVASLVFIEGKKLPGVEALRG
ncbi:MAG TPA: phosphoglycerate kinase, partial [Polyangiaceae bacterium]|nr:phosphoglycerate kinase [Polyangiaceae bacterium]